MIHLGHLPMSASGPLLVPSPVPCFSSLLRERQVSIETESEIGIPSATRMYFYMSLWNNNMIFVKFLKARGHICNH